MHSTKTEILTVLKRHDGATVDDLASSLRLAPMTVRQHLTALERDELVAAQEVRRTTGRPHFRYRLTELGHRRLGEGYDRLATLLVDSAVHLNGSPPGGDVRRQLFRLAGEALAQQHISEIAALPEDARVARAVAILRGHGGFAEFHHEGGVIEIRDFGCVFRATVGGGGPCEWHEAFLRVLFEERVAAAAQPEDGCAACCRYIIPAR